MSKISDKYVHFLLTTGRWWDAGFDIILQRQIFGRGFGAVNDYSSIKTYRIMTVKELKNALKGISEPIDRIAGFSGLGLRVGTSNY